MQDLEVFQVKRMKTGDVCLSESGKVGRYVDLKMYYGNGNAVEGGYCIFFSKEHLIFDMAKELPKGFLLKNVKTIPDNRHICFAIGFYYNKSLGKTCIPPKIKVPKEIEDL